MNQSPEKKPESTTLMNVGFFISIAAVIAVAVMVFMGINEDGHGHMH